MQFFMPGNTECCASTFIGGSTVPVQQMLQIGSNPVGGLRILFLVLIKFPSEFRKLCLWPIQSRVERKCLKLLESAAGEFAQDLYGLLSPSLLKIRVVLIQLD